ncbi:MAG TPA: hypothetical protein VHU87_04215 [Rhizomicrobium sp.]|jgi:hypothetical protein|nr:hypothetical protein [Rhizomicrobium sp.]
MDPISNADRLVLLLRQKLQERAKAGASARPGKKAEQPATRSGIQALAAVEGSDERPLRRALIQNLLADQLGPALLNDAQFQQIVSRVTEAIEDDPGASQLLSRLVSELRPS